jgi:hypothetical protein
MAQVPVYGGPQVRSNALQPVQQREIDVSSGMQALSRGLGQVADAADRIAERADSAAAFDAEVKLRADWMETDAELRKRYRGVNAVGYRDEVEKWWGEAPRKYGADLSPRGKMLASRSMQQIALQARGGAIQWEEGEITRGQREAFTASKVVEVQSALTAGTPEAIAIARANITRKNAEQGAREGWDGKVLEQENLRDTSVLHASYLTKLMDLPDGVAKAKAYYEANRAEIAANLHAGIEDKLEKVGRVAFAQDKADEAFGLHGNDMQAAMAYVEKTYSGENEKAIKAELASRFQVAEASRRDTDERNYGTASLEYEQTGRVRPSTMALLSDGKRAQLLRVMKADQKARAAAANGGVKTDWATYIDAREKLAAGQAVELKALVDRIAPAQMEQLLDIQTRRSDPKKAPEVATSEQQIGSFTRQMDLKGEKLGQFQAAAYDLFNEHLKAKGKEPTYDERQAILDKLVQDVVIKPGWIWDTTGPAYTAPREVRNAAMKPATTVKVRSLDEARALPKGTRFIDPNGVERIR